MISLVTSSEACLVVEEVRDSIEAASIREVSDLLVDLAAADLEIVDSEADRSNRKVLMHMQIFLSVLMKQSQAAIKSFICRMKMAGHSHCRFTSQLELIQEKVSA